MERGSSKHGPRLDDQQKRETEAEAELGRTGYAPGHEPGTPEGISAEAVDLRSELARWLSDAAFPAEPRELLTHAERTDAPDEVRQVLSSLPPGRYANMAEVAEGLGLGVEKRRW